MKIIIREYQAEDYYQIERIHDLARLQELKIGKAEKYFKPLEKAIYKEDLFNSKIYVACNKQKIIGFIAVKPNILDYIYVDPAYQGQGVGKNLISYVLRIMKRPITLEVFQENKVAKKLYSHFGFKTKKIIYQQWDGNDPQKYSDETMALEK